ncbi:MAG: ribose-phosphate diphosphokinase, partial [Pseudolabrys sp.]
TPLTKADVRRFADMEIFVEIKENVRGADVFVIQSTSFPANDHLMELLIIIDALKRASARRITAVIPYFGYARQDRKPGPRAPISAKLVANLITRAGADRVMTLDLHAGQIQGFFDIPTDNLYASPLMVRDIKENIALDNVMVVSPDVGGVARARGLAKRINAPLAIVDKRRERPGESEVMNVIGEVEGHSCVLVDDIVDSAGTLVNAADALLAQGAKQVCGKQSFSFNKPAYKWHHRIENAFCRLKDFRRIATRYDRLARNYLASVCLIAVIVWWT